MRVAIVWHQRLSVLSPRNDGSARKISRNASWTRSSRSRLLPRMRNSAWCTDPRCAMKQLALRAAITRRCSLGELLIVITHSGGRDSHCVLLVGGTPHEVTEIVTMSSPAGAAEIRGDQRPERDRNCWNFRRPLRSSRPACTSVCRGSDLHISGRRRSTGPRRRRPCDAGAQEDERRDLVPPVRHFGPLEG